MAKVHIECLEIIRGFLGAEYLPIEGSSASRRLRMLISIFRTEQLRHSKKHCFSSKMRTAAPLLAS